MTRTLALCALPSDSIAAASSAGPMSDEGVGVRSRASASATMMAVARALSAPCGQRILAPALAFLERYRSKRQVPSPIATAASVADTGAVSVANLQVPAGSLVASAPKSQRAGFSE